MEQEAGVRKSGEGTGEGVEGPGDHHVSAFVRCMSMGFPNASESKPGMRIRERARSLSYALSLVLALFLFFSLSPPLSPSLSRSHTRML